MRLNVELYGVNVGTIIGENRTFDFQPSQEALDTFGINSTVLSVCIPLTPRARKEHASRRRNWFKELFPEGQQYQYMLSQGQLRQGDTLGFLARYGRDIAGALQIWDLDDPTEPRKPALLPLNEYIKRTLARHSVLVVMKSTKNLVE